MLDAKPYAWRRNGINERLTLSYLSLLVRGINKRTQMEFLGDLSSLRY